MATYVNGTDMVVYVDDTATAGGESSPSESTLLGVATSVTLNVEIDAPETTVKADSDKKQFMGLSRSWTIEADAFYSEVGESVDFYTLWNAAYGDNSTASTSPVIAGYPRRVYVVFKGATGGNEYKGYAYITNISATGGTEDAGTMSVTFTGSGDLEYSAS